MIPLFFDGFFVVKLDNKSYDKSPKKVQSSMEATTKQLFSQGEHLGIKHKGTTLQMKHTCAPDSLHSINRSTEHFSWKNPGKEYENLTEDHSDENLTEDHSGSDSDGKSKKNASSFIKSAKPLKVSGGPDRTEDVSLLHLDGADPTLPTEVMAFICWLNNYHIIIIF